MSIYGFRAGPSYRPATKSEQFMAALEMPMNPVATFFDQAKGGALESFGLGTVIRDFAIPQGTQPREVGNPYGAPDFGPVTTAQRAYEAIRGIFNPVQDDATALSEHDWKASPYYRDSIPYDPGMTADRAAALAIWEDAKRVREFYGSKNPVVSFIGGFAGQALDPINYIPVAGPAVKAAAVARAGRIGGAVVASSLDAAANTAAFGLLTSQARAEYGDDVSWQAMVSEIATAALVGAAFGGVSGALELRQARRAESSLATLRETQSARSALNDAVTGLVVEGEVRLRPSSVSEIETRAAARPAFNPTLLADFDREDLFRTTAVGRVIDTRPINVIELEDALRQDVIASDDALRVRWEQAESKFKAAEDRVAEVEATVQSRRTSDAVATIDEGAAARLRAIEDEMAGRVSAARRATLEAERDLIVESIGRERIAKIDRDARIGPEKAAASARKRLATARREFAAVKRDVDGRIQADRALRQVRPAPVVDTTLPREESPPEGFSEAAKAVATSENVHQIAQAHQVNPESGDFAEQADIERLEQDGRLTGDDRAELTTAEEEYQRGAAFGEALKSMVGCLL